MFETLNAGNKLSGDEFDEAEMPLRQRLLGAQMTLAKRDHPVIIIVGGVDGAGKGALIHRLNEWMDPRGIDTNTFWESSDEEESRPFFWRFWRKLPRRGRIGIFLGSWYTYPAQATVAGALDEHQLEAEAGNIVAFERLLADDGAVIVKLWLHVSEQAQRDQLHEDAGKQQNPRVTDQPYELSGNYEKTLQVAQRLINLTDAEDCRWHLLDAEDRRYRDIGAGEIILHAMEQALQEAPGPSIILTRTQDFNAPTMLDRVDLDASMPKDEYRERLADSQARLQDLAWKAYRAKRSMIAVFEGWDAAGKGSAIRRVTRAIDPRLFHLEQVGAPTDEEKARHYLWRFWRQLQRDGRVTLFDRSWYGRVLVERVEEFATEPQWLRAYEEIRHFEAQLVGHGCVLVKFWLHISPEEQLARFEARAATPHKRHKITDEDWRNRKKWADYAAAVEDMVDRTSTESAPWTLVAGNDKKTARIQILGACCEALEGALE